MDKETIRIAKEFVKKIKKKYSPVQVILFGSRARGDNFKKSDFDFIIISDYFKDKKFIYRASDLYDYWDYSFDFEPLCYTSEEFERKKKQRGIVQQALKEGIEITAV
ncbi:MAG: nucleotidyltransferase domain-containing protein [Nanoarchaeota archaeon]